MKYKFAILFFSLLFYLGSCRSDTILIDPGHGGEDIGAKGSFRQLKGEKKKRRPDVLEKDLALVIAKKLASVLKKKHNVFLTRTIDRTITLEERADLADKIQADLFVSLHINSSRKSSSSGHEIYYLDTHNDIAAKRVEKLENINLKGDKLIIQKILIDLVVERTSSISKKLASDIQLSLKGVMKKFDIKNRGAKPGLFYVLALSKRPAVLLEVGFLSNSFELRKMISEKFQNSYVRAVANGINKFIKKRNRDKLSVSVL